MRLDGECHIVSVIVHVLREFLDSATTAIGALESAEIQVTDGAGRFVVLLEAEDEAHILAAFRELENISGVLSVALVYHEVDAA